ncbi:hypothetical protein SAMN04487948_11484 [Halogranum amylolyticum]|uniref:Uncharacterized protein n=2 Tax=Halogranum amylolyticum TaxID=660520 RepID=A0A1H8V699_9EURY|nr:hypothetical protein SAMN04487948_11484 [Halogranum amylolyticum]
MGGPSNEKYQAFERFVRKQPITVTVPESVAEELGESLGGYEYQRDCLRGAQDSGWLEPGHIDFSVPRVPEVVDKRRARMEVLSADDVTEDEIEETDTILAGFAYQYVAEGASHVSVFVSDQIAERAIRDALSAVGIGDRVSAVEGRNFLHELID